MKVTVVMKKLDGRMSPMTFDHVDSVEFVGVETTGNIHIKLAIRNIEYHFYVVTFAVIK